MNSRICALALLWLWRRKCYKEETIERVGLEYGVLGFDLLVYGPDSIIMRFGTR